ncbi:MAG: CoA-binding protein [Candidatus Micrarchaeia archaeon]
MPKRNATPQQNIRAVLEPESIVVVGASRDPSKVGHAILKNLLINGYAGRLYAVNPHADEILGVKCYKSVSEIRQRVDCAIISVPAKYVNGILEECGKKGIRGAVVVSGGFKEIGEYALEEELKRIAEKHGIAVIGPNCLGIVNANRHLDSIFLPSYKLTRPQLGGISFITQSGAVGSTVLDLIGESNIGISKFISYGNAAVLDESDLLGYLRDDSETKVIVMYIEGVANGRKFYEELRKTTPVKPVVVLKAGRGSLAAAATKSHTGSLAGNYEVFSAMLRQAGAVEADNLEDFFNLSKIFMQPLPRGNKVLVITNGGGDGVLTVDAIERSGMRLASLSKETIAKMKRIFPKHVVVGNPLDLTGDADSSRYRIALQHAISEPDVDAIVVITLFQTAGLGAEVVNEVISAANSTDKTLVAVATGGKYTKLQLSILESYCIPAYESPEDAVISISKAHTYAKMRARVARGQ